MHEFLTLTVVRHSVHQPRVGVESKYDRFIRGKDGLVFGCFQAVRVVAIWLEFEQVHDVDETDLELREVLAEKSSSGQCLLSDDVSARGDHDIGLGGIVAGPVPDTQALGTVGNGVFHVEVLRVDLLIGNDYVDVVLASEAVVHGRKQAVGIWW